MLGCMDRVPATAEEALCYMVECELATLAWIRMIKRTSKSDIARHTSIASTGIEAIRLFADTNTAARVGAGRVVRILNGEREI